MLKRFRVVGLCLVAVFALSAVAASSASAFTTFKAKLPTGGTFPASVTGTGGEQVFTDETGGTPVKCTAATATGVANSTSEPTTIQKVKYTGCKASIDNVHEIVAEYKIHANGEVDIVNPIAIKVEGIGACEIVVGAQEKLKLLTFENNAAKTEITTKAKEVGITSKGSGGLCGGAHTGGTYTGTVISKLEKGGELFVE